MLGFVARSDGALDPSTLVGDKAREAPLPTHHRPHTLVGVATVAAVLGATLSAAALRCFDERARSDARRARAARRRRPHVRAARRAAEALGELSAAEVRAVAAFVTASLPGGALPTRARRRAAAVDRGAVGDRAPRARQGRRARVHRRRRARARRALRARDGRLARRPVRSSSTASARSRAARSRRARRSTWLARARSRSGRPRSAPTRASRAPRSIARSPRRAARCSSAFANPSSRARRAPGAFDAAARGARVRAHAERRALAAGRAATTCTATCGARPRASRRPRATCAARAVRRAPQRDRRRPGRVARALRALLRPDLRVGRPRCARRMRARRARVRVPQRHGQLPVGVPDARDAAVAAGRARDRARAQARAGAWEFTVSAQRPSTGPALLDVRFGGERVLYEHLSAGRDGRVRGRRPRPVLLRRRGVEPLDALGESRARRRLPRGRGLPRIGRRVPLRARGRERRRGRREPRRALLPGVRLRVDRGPHGLAAHGQHRAAARHGLLRRTVVVRSIATVGNYDYITDFKLREDGEIEVSTRFAGYIESRHFDAAAGAGELERSTRLRADLAGPVHSHIVCFKADLDVGGARAQRGARHVGRDERRADRRRARLEGAAPPRDRARGRGPLDARRRPRAAGRVERRRPRGRSPRPRRARARGYADIARLVRVDADAARRPPVRARDAVLQVARRVHAPARRRVPRDEPDAMQYDAVRADGANGAQDLERFLADEEGLLDEDLVAWISVGREHVTRQEDLPLVSNFGVAFSLLVDCRGTRPAELPSVRYAWRVQFCLL